MVLFSQEIISVCMHIQSLETHTTLTGCSLGGGNMCDFFYFFFVFICVSQISTFIIQICFSGVVVSVGLRDQSSIFLVQSPLGLSMPFLEIY